MEISYTIPQFAAAYHISRVHYYTLKAQGKAPQEIRLGRRVIITRRAAEEWEERMAKEQNASLCNEMSSTPSVAIL
jgi:predicted DNA-binding transcriptional regulator AlpA